MRYREKTVLVTGVARQGQVGEYLAAAFAREGARVIAVDRDAAELGARVDELAGRGLNVSGLPCDLTSMADVDRLTARVASEGGRLHALVNAAGGFAPSGPVAESDPGTWARMRAINFDTAYLCTRALLPALRAGEGAIVYFSAAAALPGGRTAGLAGYIAAKAAVLALMRTVAEEERKSGVRANAVAPTAVRTAANLESMGDEVRYVEREELAAVVLHLCDASSSAVSGEVIRLG